MKMGIAEKKEDLEQKASNKNIEVVSIHRESRFYGIFALIGYVALFSGTYIAINNLRYLNIYNSEPLASVFGGFIIALLGIIVILLHKSFDSIHENTQYSKEMLELIKQK